MAKAKDAFRTISEVAEWLDTPTHVLRFWESKFAQIKPVKGAGGRRYYRPEDMELLGGIKQLLHVDGLTIKGTQKILREQGVKYVATLGQTLAETPAPTEAPPPKAAAPTPAAEPQPVPPVQPAQTAMAFDAPPPAPAPAPAAARLLGLLPSDMTALRAKAAEIAPLVRRLEVLRARMAG
ncbi:MerR family transcriptional regulator [Yoonia sp.]|uniref:MerR family transcriptional regulator n=1 Tax=Yoonia sp. TaxID=2212373 RepID=UPI002FDA2DFF